MRRLRSPNSLAAVLMLAITLILGLMISRDLRASSLVAWIAWVLGLLLVVAMLLATKSRTAVLATTMALIGLLIHRWFGWRVAHWWHQRQWTKQDRAEEGNESNRSDDRKRWFLIAVLLVILMGTGMYAASRWDARLFSEASMSVRFRAQYWLSTIAMIHDHPWFGVGPGGFRIAYPFYRAESAAEVVADPHNWLLELFATAGIPGGFMFLVALTGFAWYRLRPTSVRNAPTIELAPSPHHQTTFNVPLWAYDIAVAFGILSAIVWGWPQGFTLLGIPMRCFFRSHLACGVS